MMKHPSYIRKIFKNDAGVAAVEFALIIPVLALLLTGIIDYGLYANKLMQAQSLSRKAAEYVVQGGLEENVREHIYETSDFYLNTSINRTSIEFEDEIICECAGGEEALTCGSVCPANKPMRSYYAVTITATYTPLLPYPGLSEGVTLRGYSQLEYAR